MPSLPIGVPAVLPIDVAEAYTTFANLGVRVEPRPILRVEDPDGTVVWEVQPERERVLEPEVAYIMVDMMKDVVNAGSGAAVRNPDQGNIPYTLPVAGKTGTTNDATDVWFAGFTPNLLAVVWLGFDMPQPILPSAAGGVYAAPVWADFVRPVYFDEGEARAGSGTEAEPRIAFPQDWPRPDGLVTAVIDRGTGELFNPDWCPQDAMREELYLPGTEPTELCDVHAPGLFGAPLRGLPQDLPDTSAPDSAPDSTGGG
ncbi:MAG: hypothetical protein GWM90_08460 [Gemmatimonadetes bacterium]|nr:hypothetical protein [Gemmatimonadota bacterium]NIQ55359.1 hypothetical protein [Gemmatimonadota bacterium]NIU75564.1 hypothetical protein [Gammaproteobacteria bacterium]NIX44143.1 hypothetical protein [Gemmatimonadota bacterium]NIY09541.1 hypothetical protein [Gemmatimonadota bacterium]